MDARISSLVDILRLNTRLFRNCLDGFTDAQAVLRPTPGTNSAAFVAAHLADSRFYLLKLLGSERENPLARYLSAAKTIDDVKEYPSMTETLSAWSDVSHALRDRLEAITAPELDEVVSPRFPMPNPTRLSALTFLVQHDSYHIGQLALLRKHAGLPAMSYRSHGTNRDAIG
jgi:uncharacterized damage-inducible protein DinB